MHSVSEDNRSFRTTLVGRVYLARAFGNVTKTDLALILRSVAAARKVVGQPLLYWPMFTEVAEAPNAEMRAALQRATATLFSYCESMTLIIPGAGLKPSLLRTALRGMVLVGGYADRIRIAEDLTRAVGLANDPALDTAELERAARKAGIIVGA